MPRGNVCTHTHNHLRFSMKGDTEHSYLCGASFNLSGVTYNGIELT